MDTEAFVDAAAVARRSREPAAYRAAVGLYAGELLPDDRYEIWAEERREALRLTYLSLLVELAGLYEEHGAAIDALQRVVSEEPSHEEAHLSLMRLYAGTCQRQQALSEYERLRQALARELGAEPDAESRRAYEEIVTGRARTARGPPFAGPSLWEKVTSTGGHNLPVSLTSFVGRERELAEVERLLLGTARLLTLTGAGGSGKSRLALQLARNLVGAYPDGVWLVELASLADPALVPQAVTRTLGVPEQPDRALTKRSRAPCGSKRCCWFWTTASTWWRPAPALPRRY